MIKNSIKKIIAIIFILSIVFLVSCTNLDNYVPIEKYDEVHLAYVEAKQDRSDLKNENKSLKSDIDNLQTDIGNVENEVEKYKYLLSNLDSFLENVYYVYQKRINGNYYYESWGTGFSLKYGDKIFLITAGHCVENELGKFGNLGFKTNFSNDWIYPELLTYENDFINRNDYAIFYGNEIKDGFIIDDDNDLPEYILGNDKLYLNIIKPYGNISNEGESGSPIIDYSGEITGILITATSYTPIERISEAIYNLKQDIN